MTNKINPILLGAIIGDVVGSAYEFDTAKPSKDVELITERSSFTDDTITTTAVMDVMLSGDLSQANIVNTMQKWCRHYEHPMGGYGGMFRTWVNSNNPKPYGSKGNGAAMRISPVGLLANSMEEVKTMSKAITEITHNSYNGVKGAEVTAMCVYMAKNYGTKQDIRDYLISKYPEVKDFTYDKLVRNYTYNEICETSVPQAIYCFLISESYEDCLLNILSIGGDSDTLCAIGGAVAMAYYKTTTDDLIKKVISKLDDDILIVLEQATDKLMKGDR